MNKVSLHISYTPKQEEFLFKTDARFRIVAKGRRFGFTRGCAQAVIEWALEKPRYILWGDTVAGNIHGYYKRYMEPVLRQISQRMWRYYKQEHRLEILNSIIEFRSADRPENWEGFGYDFIVLNEAGIILKNRYLWENAVRPMMLDNPKSTAIIGGVPKGMNIFYELYRFAEGDHKEWQAFKFSSYDNPTLRKEDIDQLIQECATETVIKQEIFAEFIDSAGSELFSYELIRDCMNRQVTDDMRQGQEVWALDVARQGGDMCVLAKRLHRDVYEVKPLDPDDDLIELVDILSHEYSKAKRKPVAIYIDVTQMGWGVFDEARKRGLPVKQAVMGAKSGLPEAKNRRAEMFLRLGKYMREGLKLPKNNNLLVELSAIELKPDEELATIIPKKQIRNAIGRSPDYADAVGMLFYEDIFASNVIQFMPVQKAVGW